MASDILVGIVVGILLLIFGDLISWFWGVIGIKIPKIAKMDDLLKASPIFLLGEVGILSPLQEEILFRFVPLYPAMLYNNDYLTWSIAILASIIFGPIHGSWKHILNIGVVGMIFSWLFINFGFVSCLTAHITNNLLFSCYILLKRNFRPSPRLS